jgi:probable H4MPT-linked C1 transfer pathway protein
MRYDELLYTGVVRTPLMALASRVPLAGDWVGLMAEHFATAADIYRLTGELPEHADQYPAADQGPKTPAGSRRRLARMFGRDAGSLPADQWDRVAGFLRERQLAKIRAGLELQLSRESFGVTPALVGAGIGRFLIRDLSRRMGMDYLDFSTLFSGLNQVSEFHIDDCAPAAAVACLALKEVGTP